VTHPVIHTMQVSWSLPQIYADGSPLALSDIGSTLIAWGSQQGGPYPNEQSTAALGTSAVVPYPGTAGISYYVVLYTVLRDGTRSAASVEAVKKL
jgi:hypothetical protein